MKKETRFAHSEGITDIAIHKDGNIVTVGNDADVRIWNGYSDEDPVSFSASDSCFGIKVTDEGHVIVSTENNTVECYEYPKGKFLSTKLKFTSAVNHVDVSKDGKVVVAGSADMTIQVIGESGGLPKKIDAHGGPVLAVSIDPLVKFFASSGCDGNVSVWSLEKPEQPLKKWFKVFPSSNDIALSSTLCRMAWHPNQGKYLAVPSSEKIILYGRDTWDVQQTLSCSKLTKLFSVVQFSPCGLYICGGGTDGTIVIWDAAAFTVKMQIKESQHITGMAFNSKNDELLCTDISGRLISVREYLTTDTSSSGTKATDDKTVGGEHSPNDERDENDVFGDGIDYAMFDDDDDDENAFSITKIKADVGFVGDEYVGPSKAKKAVNKGDMADDDDSKSVSSVGSSKVSRAHAAPSVAYNPFTAPQKSFQPGSTPEHLTHRFMVWNNVGIIRCYSTEDEEISDDAIDIEFHDATFHHAIHLRNQQDYSIGNVSNEVVALACGRTADSPAKLFCLNFSSWDSNKEWTADMPSGEEVIGIALGTGWIAASTSENRIRIFSVGGIQKFMYDFGGTIVAVAGFENLLFVTYHNGVGTNGNQSISFAVLKFNSTSTKLSPLMVDAPLPLSKQATLSWIGFTDEGTPAYSDSKDLLRVLNGRLWSPYCNMRASLHSANDHYWVVGVSETAAHVRAVKCKGTKYPMTLPRPTIMMLDAQIPLCEMDTEKSKMEDTMLQALIMDAAVKKMERKCFDVEEYKDKSEASAKETLFKLFVLATKSNRDLRAAEYVAMMPTAYSMQIAVKFASKSFKNALTDRLQTIGRKKMEQEEEDVDEVDDFECSSIITHTEHRTVSMNDSDRSYAESLPSTPQGNSRAHPVITLEDNPLLKKQKDEIRSILSSGALRKNPFKKDSSASSTTLSRQSSFNGSLAKNNSAADTVNTSQLAEDSQSGMAKIDVWRKPVEKAVSLPEFNPKDPKRKSATIKSNDKQAAPKRANPFEKKGKDKENGAKSQRKLFDMAGMKSKGGNKSASNSNPSSPAVVDEISQDASAVQDPNGEGETQFIDANIDSPGSGSEGGEKKRKRDDEIIEPEKEKKSRVSAGAAD